MGEGGGGGGGDQLIQHDKEGTCLTSCKFLKVFGGKIESLLLSKKDGIIYQDGRCCHGKVKMIFFFLMKSFYAFYLTMNYTL